MALNRNDSFNPSDLSWMDAGSDPQDRWFITKAMKFVFGAGKGFASGVAEGKWEKETEKNFKNLESVTDEINEISEAASKSLKEFGDTWKGFKGSVRELGLSYTEALGHVLPGGIYRRLSRAFEEPEQEQKGRSEEDRYEDSIQSTLSSVFSAQSRLSEGQHAASMKSAAADRMMNARYHQQSMGVMSATNTAVAHIDSFLSTTYTNYLKKDLELKYRSYRVTNLMHEKISVISEAFGKDGIMQQLVGGSDDDKNKSREVYTAGGYTRNLYKNIFDNALSVPTTFLNIGGMLLSAWAQDPIQGIEGLAKVAGKLGATKVLDYAKNNLLSEKWKKRVDKGSEVGKDFLKLLSGDFGYFLQNKSGLINSFGARMRGSDNKLFQWIGGLIPEFSRKKDVENKVVSDPKGVAAFDNITRETIISVIPRHLERIGDIFEAFTRQQGIKPEDIDHKTYDFRSRGLITKKEQRRRNIEALYGDQDTRKGRYATNVNTFLNLSAYLNIDQQTQAAELIEQNKDALHMFIMKSARANRMLDAKALIKWLNDDSLTFAEEDYINEVFGGVDSASGKNAARTIYSLIVKRDKNGRTHGIEPNYVRQINRAITNISRDVDTTDQVRVALEDLGMYDEEDYTYDLEGTATINERSREREFLNDREGVTFGDIQGGEIDENVLEMIKLRDKYRNKHKLKYKDAQTRLNIDKLNRSLNSNAVAVLGGKYMNELMDWLEIGNVAANDMIGGISESKILKGATDFVAQGKKNVITRLTFFRDTDKENKKKELGELFDPIYIRVAISTPLKQEIREDIKDFDYTVADAYKCHVNERNEPNLALKNMVDRIIAKLGKDKYTAKYSDRFVNMDYISGADKKEESVLDEELRKDADFMAGKPKAGSKISISGNKTDSYRHTFIDYLSSIDKNLAALGKYITTKLSFGLPGAKSTESSDFEFLTQDERATAAEEKARKAEEDKQKAERDARIAKEKERASKDREEEQRAKANRKFSIASQLGRADSAKREETLKKEIADLKLEYKKLKNKVPYPNPKNDRERNENNRIAHLRDEALRNLQDKQEEYNQLIKDREEYNTETWVKEEEDYLNEEMSKDEMSEAHKKLARAVSNAKTPEAKAAAQQKLTEFRMAVDSGDWKTARSIVEMDVNKIDDLTKRTAMRREEHASAKAKLLKAAQEQYKQKLSKEEIEKLRKLYTDISQHKGKKYTEEQKIEANQRLALLNQDIKDKKWEQLRRYYNLNEAADTFEKYKAAYKEKNWKVARELSETYDTTIANGKNVYENVMTKMNKTVRGRYMYRFTPEYDSIIRENLREVIRMLRRIPEDDEKAAKAVLKALESLDKAFGDRKTRPATRTKAMAKALDKIMTDQDLRYYRTGEVEIVGLTEGAISDEDEEEKENADRLDEYGKLKSKETKEDKKENPALVSLKERFKMYEELGVKTPLALKIIDRLEGNSGDFVDNTLNALTRLADDIDASLPEDAWDKLAQMKELKGSGTAKDKEAAEATYLRQIASMREKINMVITNDKLVSRKGNISRVKSHAESLREMYEGAKELPIPEWKREESRGKEIEDAWNAYVDASREREEFESGFKRSKASKKQRAEHDAKLADLKQKEQEALDALSEVLADDPNTDRKNEYQRKIEDQKKLTAVNVKDKPEPPEDRTGFGKVTGTIGDWFNETKETVTQSEAGKRAKKKLDKYKKEREEKKKKGKKSLFSRTKDAVKNLGVKIKSTPENESGEGTATTSSSYADGSFGWFKNIAHLFAGKFKKKPSNKLDVRVETATEEPGVETTTIKPAGKVESAKNKIAKKPSKPSKFSKKGVAPFNVAIVTNPEPEEAEEKHYRADELTYGEVSNVRDFEDVWEKYKERHKKKRPPKKDDKNTKIPGENKSFLGRIFGIFNPLLKQLKKITKVDDSDKVYRTAVRAGLSPNTAAILSFMSTMARKIDNNTLGVAAAIQGEKSGLLGWVSDTFGPPLKTGWAKVKDFTKKSVKKAAKWTAGKIRALLNKIGPIPTIDFGGFFSKNLFKPLGRGINNIKQLMGFMPKGKFAGLGLTGKAGSFALSGAETVANAASKGTLIKGVTSIPSQEALKKMVNVGVDGAAKAVEVGGKTVSSAAQTIGAGTKTINGAKTVFDVAGNAPSAFSFNAGAAKDLTIGMSGKAVEAGKTIGTTASKLAPEAVKTAQGTIQAVTPAATKSLSAAGSTAAQSASKALSVGAPKVGAGKVIGLGAPKLAAVLGPLAAAAAAGGMGFAGSKSSGAGTGSSLFSAGTGALGAGLLAANLSNPIGWAALAAMGANSVREGWNDKKTLKKSWGSETGLDDYKKGASATGNLLNYLSFGLLNKTGGRKYVDKAMQYTQLGHMIGGTGGTIAGIGDMAKSLVRDESSPMNASEMKKAEAKLKTDIKRGDPEARKKLRDFQQAVAEGNWVTARDICGVHVDNKKEFKQGLKRTAKGVLAMATLGASSMIEMWADKLIGNPNEPMTEKEIKEAYRRFAVLEKKDKAYKEKRLDFEEAVAGERWAIARKIAKMEHQGALTKKFGKAGAATLLLGGWLFGNNANEEMSEKEIKKFRDECNKLIKKGNKPAQELLDRFETAVAEGNWKMARKLSGKETSSLFSKLWKGLNRASMIVPIVGWSQSDDTISMSKKDIENFRKKMEYLKSKGDANAASKLEKFDTAVLRNDWKTARTIAKMPHKSINQKINEWTADLLFGDLSAAGADKPMDPKDIQKFRASMERKIKIGNKAAERLLEKFDDAVGRQNWRLARKLSDTRNEGLIEKLGKNMWSGVKLLGKGLEYLSGAYLFTSDQDKPLSKEEIEKFTNRMKKINNPQANDVLAKFEDACKDGKWSEARKIAGIEDKSIISKGFTNTMKAIFGKDDKWKGLDEKDTSVSKTAQRYRLIMDRVKEALQKKNLDKYAKSDLAKLRDEMQNVDVLELDDEMLDKFEARLRDADKSVGSMDAADISALESERKKKAPLIKQRDALLAEIVAAQERCGVFSSKRSELKKLFSEVESLTIEELDKELLDGYDEDLRMLDSQAVSTKQMNSAERKAMEKKLKRRNTILSNIQEVKDNTNRFLHPFKFNDLNRLYQEVESAIPEEMDDELFDAWDAELKDIDPQGHDSKERSKEELKKLKELNRKRNILLGMIDESIDNCGLLEFKKRADLKTLKKEVESALEEDLTEEQMKEWEEELKDLDENAMTVEEKDASIKKHKELLRDKRKLRVKIRITSKKYARQKKDDEAKALQKIVDSLDAIDDEEFTRDEYKDALEEFKDIDADAAKELSDAEQKRKADERAQWRKEHPEEAKRQDELLERLGIKPKDGANLKSGAKEQAVSLDKNGNIVDVQEGSPTDVSVKTKPGGQIIHTHPDGSPTSASDIAAAIQNGQTSVTTLRSSKVVGYSGNDMKDIMKETVRVQQEHADKNNAELHSFLGDLVNKIKDGFSSNEPKSDSEILMGIYERLGDVIDAIGDHNSNVNNNIVRSAIKSYDLAKQFTLSKTQNKKVGPLVKGSVFNISK